MVATEGTQVNALGRLVWGHPLKATQKKDPSTNQIVLKDGQPVIQHVFGIAVPKADFLATVWPAMQVEAAKGFPSGVPQNFAWKIDDGDDATPRQGGKAFAEREGYPGHYVITVASNTGFPPALYRFNGTNYDQLSEDDLKTGDWVNAALNLVVNVPTQRTHTPSLYVNPQALEFVGYGTAIVSAGVNPMAAFGGQQRALPPGASATPVSGAPGAGVQMPGTAPQQPPMQQQQPAAPGYPAPQQPHGAPPAQPDAPAAPQYQPPAQPAPGQMPPPHQQFVQPGAPAAPQYQPPAQPAPGQPQQPGYPAPGGMPPGMPGPR